MSTSTSFAALGTTALVCVGEPEALADAERILRDELALIDASCSRFRPDSELVALNADPGSPHAVSAVLFAALEVALDAARITNGILDPTIGTALRSSGYDRSFSEIAAVGPRAGDIEVVDVCGWQSIELDPSAHTVTVPEGVEIDLGATAKAFAADRAAHAIHDVTGADVLISLGGDICVAGAPPEGWPILLADDHRVSLDTPGPIVNIHGGGLATSSTTVRRWQIGDRELHHLIDPRTGTSASSPWRTVSVVASSCVAANTASSTAIILGDAAPAWLSERGLPARLVAHDGDRTYVGGWPEDPS